MTEHLSPRSGEYGSAEDRRDVRALVENWAAAVRAKNMPAILEHHSHDVVMFDVPPPLQSTGLDEYRKTWDLFYAWSDIPVVFDIDDMHVTAGAEVAFAIALMHCSSRDTSGQYYRLDFRLTIGLQKIDGRWIITHEHHSIPAENDSRL